MPDKISKLPSEKELSHLDNLNRACVRRHCQSRLKTVIVIVEVPMRTPVSMRLTARIECPKLPNYLSMKSQTSKEKACDYDERNEDYDLVNL